jgi:hypothetical protein
VQAPDLERVRGHQHWINFRSTISSDELQTNVTGKLVFYVANDITVDNAAAILWQCLTSGTLK